jgi:hypothetical protein
MTDPKRDIKTPKTDDGGANKRERDEIDTSSPGAEGGLNTVNEGVEEAAEQSEKDRKRGR